MKIKFCQWVVGLLVIACQSLVAASAAPADSAQWAGAAAEDGQPWGTMETSTQNFLSPLKDQWPSLSADSKEKWISLAQRMKKRPPAEFERAQARVSTWASLSPQERGRTRWLYKEALRVAPQTRAEQWRRYNELTGDEKQFLAKRALQQVSAQQARRTKDDSPPGPEPSWVKAKINTTPAASPRAQPLGPSVIQALPGASTALISAQTAPPAHQPAGSPKIAPSTAAKQVRSQGQSQESKHWPWHAN